LRGEEVGWRGREAEVQGAETRMIGQGWRHASMQRVAGFRTED
jgi:hypothetical protein